VTAAFFFLVRHTLCDESIFYKGHTLTETDRKKKKNHSIYYPTNAHSVKNVELLKHIKIMEAAPTFFGLQRNYHQGTTSSTQLKLQAWFSVDIEVVQTFSVLWQHSMTCVACVLCTVQAYTLTQFTTHTPQYSPLRIEE
jgi:hypothetical protein